MLVSVDPGLRASGVAVWDGAGVLLWAGYVKGAVAAPGAIAWEAMARAVYHAVERYEPHELAIELPQTYGGRAARGDTNDLIQLAAVVGAVATRLRLATTVYRPADWKGGVRKEVTAARVDESLSDNEKTRIEWPAASLRHNVYDALGIGLKRLGRR